MMHDVATIARTSFAGPDTNPSRLRIASVCELYPTQADPQSGVFVARRLSQLAALADVKMLQPVPWFPLLRARPQVGWTAESESPRVYRQRMFYFPGAMKRLDGRWLARSILPVLSCWQDETGIDLVDAHFGYPDGVGAVLAAERLGIPAFVTIRGNELYYLKKPSIRGLLLDAFSRARGHYCREQRPAGRDRCGRRRLGEGARHPQCRRPFAVFSGLAQRARTRLNLPLHSPVIVSVGQLVERKGHRVLVRAVERLRRHHPDVVLAIVGGPSFEHQSPQLLRALIDELGLIATVRLVGSQPPDMVAQWLNAADVFALCTTREGCCNAVLEALACGVPVVTTPAGDNPRYVDPPRNGYIVPADSPEATHEALERALSQSWDRQAISDSLGANGWQGVAQSVLDFFHQQLNAPTTRRSGSST